MKRIGIVLLVVAMALLAAAPAGAAPDCEKNPNHQSCSGDPPDDTVLVDVTMQLVDPLDGEGLTTDCEYPDGTTISGPLRMERTTGGLRMANEAIFPILGVHMQEVVWWRYYQYDVNLPDFPDYGTGFLGECHGGNLDPEEDLQRGALFIDIDSSGAVTHVMWHFDYYFEEGVRGKKTYVATMEHFTLAADEATLEWIDATPEIAGDTNGTVSGDFYMLHHYWGDEYEDIGYAPFCPIEELGEPPPVELESPLQCPPGNPRHMEFTIVVEPV